MLQLNNSHIVSTDNQDFFSAEGDHSWQKFTRHSALIFSLMTCLMAIFSDHFLQGVIACGSLITLVEFFGSKRFLAGFLAAFGIQWIQANALYLCSIWTLTDFRYLQVCPQKLPDAHLLSNIVLLSSAWGTSVVLKKFQVSLDVVKSHVSAPYINMKNLVLLYLGGRAVFALLGYSQKLFAILMLGQTLYFTTLLFLMFFTAFHESKGRNIFILLMVIETILGMTGFFSGFKEILYVFLLVSMLLAPLTRRNILLFCAVATTCVCMLLVWTAVKGEYRTFLNQGTSSQTVLVGKEEALEKLWELIQTTSINRKTWEQLIYRLSYVDYCAAAISHVPRYVPHEKGALTWYSLTNPWIPRFLNPHKKVQDDSRDLMKYTNLIVSDGSRGTSISLGYPAYLYIDFGFWLAPAAAFLLGMLLATLLTGVLHLITDKTIQMAFFLTFSTYLRSLETSLIKVCGNFIISAVICITAILIIRVVIKTFVNNVQPGTEKK